MSIVLNEYEWAEKAIRDRDLGKKPGETIGRIAKYYLHNGYSKKETRDLLDAFVLRCDPNSSITKWSVVLDNSVKYASKYPLVILDEVPITVQEMQRIDELKSRQAKRLAFTLLCIAKYKYLARGNAGYWVGTNDSEIMSMANINTSIKRQSLLFGQLREAGLIRFSKKIDNLDVQVLFVSEGDTAVSITDFRNLGYQYLKYRGEPYFECQCCGLTIKQNTGAGRKQKYCSCCAAKVKMQQSVNAVMRIRNKVNMEEKSIK